MSATSPKRKRGPILPLDTKDPISRLLGDSDVGDHVESPRTKIARQFDDLDIHGSLEQLDNGSVVPPKQHTGDTTHHPVDPPTQSTEFASPTSKWKQQNLSIDTVEDGGKPATEPSPVNQSRSKSPPLEGEPSDEFWHDSEITGHDPDDPDDDGYGINGIGFKPTAALAWSRSQQRKQQLNEYRNREAKEARQRRSERRKRVFDEGDEAPSLESSPRKAVRVHFKDG
ncbi:hypothetical protein H2200_005684 [Cladophialophora chaetospira]|uniref:Uncharacterized protein n=1 Tax=Cladophialophora chaetospira TaxID=386627 RepID=A0AA39CIL8_9EURO|nr:hypothetical protein H2200_005684 [Cladophialophora chaetospira]